MKTLKTLFLLSTIGVVSSHAETPEWQTTEHFNDGQLKPHALVVPYQANDYQAIRNFKYQESPYYLDLNGKW
ncbi:MAG: hypothetical protein K2F80_05280, partial [Muribaculaceae bacterium]|nr:hypothetical protein [Muribaculaceae bacterium]